MRKRPLLLAASFFLAGISYAAVKDIRIVVLLPFCALYLIIPQIKVLGFCKKVIAKTSIHLGMLVLLFLIGNMHMKKQIEFREFYLSNLSEGQTITILGKISKIEPSSFGYQIYVSDCYLFQNVTYLPCNQVLVYASKPQVHVGEIHKITGKLQMFSTSRNEGNFDSALYYQSLKIDFAMQMKQNHLVATQTNKITQMALQLKQKLANVYDNCLNDKNSGIVKGMVLGDKSTLDDKIKDLYTKAGISHMLAISGLHVSVIGRGLYHCLRKIGCGFSLSGIFAGSVLLFYGRMTGNSVSTRRAIGMLLIYMIGQVFGKSYDMLNGLGAICLFLLWENPFLIHYSGFWFFVTALFGVGFVGDVFTKRILEEKEENQKNLENVSKKDILEKDMLEKDISVKYKILKVRVEKERFQQSTIFKEKSKQEHRSTEAFKIKHKETQEVSWILRMKYRISSSLWMSIAITITTLPMVAYSYFEIPMLSFVMNCMLIPLLTPLFFCALFGGIAGLFFMPLAKIILFPCGLILKLYEIVCSWNEKIPFLTAITGKPSIEKIVFYYLFLAVGVLILQYLEKLEIS